MGRGERDGRMARDAAVGRDARPGRLVGVRARVPPAGRAAAGARRRGASLGLDDARRPGAGSLRDPARGPLLAWAVAGLALAGLVRALAPRPPGRPEPRGGPVDWAATVGLALTLWAIALIGIPTWLRPERTISDGPIYHLPFAVQWWKSGRLSIVPAPFGDTAVSYLPADGELLFAALMALAGGEFPARAGSFVFLILASAAAFGIARRLGAGASAAILGVCLFVTTLHMLKCAFVADVDVIFVAGNLAAAYFLLGYARRDGDAGTLALAGLAAGGAWGTKVIGTVFVPPLLAAAAVAVVARGGSLRGRLGHLIVLALAPWPMAGYWFARNAWLTGNPLYPLQVAAFGRVWLPGWFESPAMRHSPFYLPPGDLRILVNTVLNVLDPRLAPLWLAGWLAAWVPRRGRPEGRWAGVVATLALTDVALFWLIPYRTQQRFLLTAVGLATAPLACLLDRARWLRWIAAGLLPLHLLTPATWPLNPYGRETSWGLSGTLIGVTHGPVPAILTPAEWRAAAIWPDLTVHVGETLLTAALALAVARDWTAAGHGLWTRRRLRAALAAAALFVLPCGVALVWTDEGAADFPASAVSPHLGSPRPAGGHRRARIAYAGTNSVYYLMGRGQRHDVAYVNVNAHRDWRLHDYHREAIARGGPNWPDPYPGWDRLHPDYAAWLANLAAERIDFLFVARPDRAAGRYNIADRDGYPIERVWADAHPEAFTLVYGPAEGERFARIYRVHPADAPPIGPSAGAPRSPGSVGLSLSSWPSARMSKVE